MWLHARELGVRPTPIWKRAKASELHLHSTIQTDYPIPYCSKLTEQRAPPRPRAYKYRREVLLLLPQLPRAREHPEHERTTTARHQRRVADRRRRTCAMDGQPGNGGGAGGSDAVARAFVEYYYNTFDASRGALAALYGHTSMLSFEGHAVAGAEAIGRKLAQLPFDQCRHSICTVDCQPSPSFPGSILVFVSGNLQLAGEEHQLRFSQMFQLVPNEQGSFFVQNDIFRLNYG
ncbi:hypothetical protein SEVIR_5G348800v4 [Setaria viridis]|uniref:NTF2 domain-containing protein n=1 Tax=Setaria viridis TaxID=4556 RepID=A0A4U6URL8_SETVI|nr:nuclear transport factor 2B-like [Setaria viridis]TKW17173.1 hypothetical protein SEVIR_5G348800v2 [Setaria viridis]